MPHKQPGTSGAAKEGAHKAEADNALHTDHHTMGHRIDRLEDHVNERLASMTDAFFAELAALKSFILQGGSWLLAVLGTVIVLLFNWEWEQAKHNAEAHKEAAVLNERTSTQLIEATNSIRVIQAINTQNIEKLGVEGRTAVQALREEQQASMEKHEEKKHGG